MEEFYANLGFLRVKTLPPILGKKVEQIRKKHPELRGKGATMVYVFAQHKSDVSLAAQPDLLVIDGGKGQLGVAVEVLKELHFEIPAIGLAKREEEVFVPGSSVPIEFPRDSQAKFLLMRLRDEAHRFANRHREKRGAKHSVQSVLDTIPGIGRTTKEQLLEEFGTVAAIREASDEDLLAVLTQRQLAALRRCL